MSFPHLPALRAPAVPHTPISARPVARPQVRTRRYEIWWQSPLGDVEFATRIGPAIPQFEEAFSAFARGTLIATPSGHRAVEDLAPGDTVLGGSGAVQRITWMGAMTAVPGSVIAGLTPTALTRLTTDALGTGRPVPDLILGPQARILVRDSTARLATGSDGAFLPARAYLDGDSVIEVTPAAPVCVYHLMLERHSTVRAAGVEVETYHPGPGAAAAFGPQSSGLFLSMFPHLEGFAQFGPLAGPRLSAEDYTALRAG